MPLEEDRTFAGPKWGRADDGVEPRLERVRFWSYAREAVRPKPMLIRVRGRHALAPPTPWPAPRIRGVRFWPRTPNTWQVLPLWDLWPLTNFDEELYNFDEKRFFDVSLNRTSDGKPLKPE